MINPFLSEKMVKLQAQLTKAEPYRRLVLHWHTLWHATESTDNCIIGYRSMYGTGIFAPAVNNNIMPRLCGYFSIYTSVSLYLINKQGNQGDSVPTLHYREAISFKKQTSHPRG